jgi:hypothetical protein
MKANTQLKVGIGQKMSFLYKWQRTVVCCTSQCSEVTTIIDTSVGSVVTTTEEGLRESGMCESLSGCWVCAVFLPWEVMVSGHVRCTKVPRWRKRSGVSAMMREVGRGHEHHEHAVHAGCVQWIITLLTSLVLYSNCSKHLRETPSLMEQWCVVLLDAQGQKKS